MPVVIAPETTAMADEISVVAPVEKDGQFLLSAVAVAVPAAADPSLGWGEGVTRGFDDGVELMSSFELSNVYPGIHQLIPVR